MKSLAVVAALIACGCTRGNPDFDATGSSIARCGDGLCSGAETCDACPFDCGSCLNCRPGFFDCNHSATDGCETNITTPQNCGGCGNPCVARGGSNACVPAGAGFVCRPTCDLAHVDCDGDPSNGCETSFTADPGDAPEVCPGSHLTAVNEGSAESFSFGRILPAGDLDVYNVLLKEATKACNPLAAQQYNAKISLVDPSNSGLSIGVGADITSCNNSWPMQGASFCIDWSGTCALDDSRNIFFQVHGGSASCKNYTITIEYCPEGTVCPGC